MAVRGERQRDTYVGCILARYIRDLTGLFARIICKPKIRNICRYSDNIGIDCINAIARSRWGDMILLLSSFWPWLVPAIAWIGFFTGRYFRRKSIAKKTRSEEHTSELQSLMRTSYAVFCLKKKKKTIT